MVANERVVNLYDFGSKWQSGKLMMVANEVDADGMFKMAKLVMVANGTVVNC